MYVANKKRSKNVCERRCMYVVYKRMYAFKKNNKKKNKTTSTAQKYIVCMYYV